MEFHREISPHLGKGIGSMFGTGEGEAGSSDSARTKWFLIWGLNATVLSEIFLRIAIGGIISSNHMWFLLRSGPLGNLGGCSPLLSHHRLIPYRSNFKEVYHEQECGFRDPQWPWPPGLCFDCFHVTASGKCCCHTGLLPVEKWPGLSQRRRKKGYKNLAVLIGAEVHGVFYFHVVSSVSSSRCGSPTFRSTGPAMPWELLQSQDGGICPSPPSFLFCKLISQYKKISVCVQDLEADFEMSCTQGFLHSNLPIVRCRAAFSLRLCMFPFYSNKRVGNVKSY